jgi:L-amino acid N-acyltransferase YncA
MPASIRLATGAVGPAVTALYRPFVERTAVSFEADPPSEAEMRRRIEVTLEQWPWLVCAGGKGEVSGYAYAARHRERAAYQWSADVAVYISPPAHRHGIGRALYAALFEILAAQGYCNAYAGIALPNAASVGLHETVGFSAVGVYHGVGHKCGAWHDVGWWQLRLASLPAAPAPPRPLAALTGPEDRSAIAQALQRATSMLR